MNFLNPKARVGLAKHSAINSNVGIAVGSIVAAVFIGLATSILPWWFVLPLSMVPISLLLAWRYPEIAAVLIVALQFGVLSKLTPKLPLAGGALNPEDIAIPVFLVILALKNSRNLARKFQIMQPYLKPLGLFLICAVVSAIIALAYRTAPVKDILNEVRPYLTWLLLPLLCLAVDDKEKVRRFKTHIFFLAIIIAMGMVFQSLSGYQIFEKGQELRDLYTLSGSIKGVVRSETPGQYLMVAALVYLFASYAKGLARRPVLFVLAGTILAAGIVVGFGRGLWLSVIFSVIALCFYSKISTYLRLGLFLITAIIILVTGALMLKPDYAVAFGNRFFSIAEEVESGSSLGRRKEENKYAFQRIIESPVIGVGLGGQYKPFGRESLNWENESRYIHNSYVQIAVKMGLPALFIALTLVWIMWRRTYAATKELCSDPALAFATFWTIVTTTLLTAATQPSLTAPSGVASIVLALFFSEAHRNKHLNGNLIQTDTAVGTGAGHV